MLFLDFIAEPDFGKFLRSLGLGKKHINRGLPFGLLFCGGFFFFFFLLRAIVGVFLQYSFQNITVRKASKAKTRKEDSLLYASGKTQRLNILASFQLSRPSEQSRSSLTH